VLRQVDWKEEEEEDRDWSAAFESLTTAAYFLVRKDILIRTSS
jgi:hypothetical protein